MQMNSNNIEEKLNAISNSLLNQEYSGFIDYLEKFAPCFGEYIFESLLVARESFEAQKHSDLDKYLYEPLQTYIKNIGKLHRPLTCLATFLALGEEQKVVSVFPVAAAIENFQTFALIHDDIADEGEVRRGQPCLHKQIGEGLAINSGDFALSMTTGLILQELKKSGFSDEKTLQILEKLTLMEYMTIEGQAMDLGWAKDNRFDITSKDYIVMATKKSAYYSVTIPCVLGAICADASDDIIEAFENFGQKVGLAFQIQDDILNLCENEFGKSKDLYSDITEGKRTLCVCCALEMGDEGQRKQLVDILKSKTNDAAKLKRAGEIIEQTGALQFAKNYAWDLCTQAVEDIKDVLPDSKWKNILLDMANWASKRKF